MAPARGLPFTLPVLIELRIIARLGKEPRGLAVLIDPDLVVTSSNNTVFTVPTEKLVSLNRKTCIPRPSAACALRTSCDHSIKY